MTDGAVREPAGGGNRPGGSVKYYKRDFWSKENLRYTKPHFRLERSARIINKIAQQKQCDLLDVGCGPATLQHLLSPNVTYYGVDIAIQEPAANLIEADLLQTPIAFGDQKFDIIVAQGFFEYIGAYQTQKLTEIADLLVDDGCFVATYVNFGHRNRQIYWPYSNVQPLAEFRDSLSRYFTIDRSFPTSHNWNHGEPNRTFMRVTQMPLNVTVPLLSRILAVEYFFICSKRPR